MSDAHYKAWIKNTDGTSCIAYDPYLESVQDGIRYRYKCYQEKKDAIIRAEGSLEQFSRGYEKFGLVVKEDGILYREWAPAAKEVFLIGEFNDWNRGAHRLQHEEFGVWSIFIPNKEDGSTAIPHASKLKCVVVTHGGMHLDRNLAWSKVVWQNHQTNLFDSVFWNPPEEWKYKWKNDKFVKKPTSLKIYECHVGMGSNDPKVGTYVEFAENVLPRIKNLGYNAIQIMAIMEHAYYASFGYHVTNFFAVSSRCGTPEELKMLIDKAHGMGIQVLMDVVHSHASSNSMDGLSQFDGTDHQYFHGGEAGYHRLWDSRCFNYGSWEVLRFLLSNLRWYCEEYHFDGFRFDGITSTLYKHHGIGICFTGNYNEYFGYHVDIDACVYLMLANEMLHELYPDTCITIAEDVSGMPTLCRPVYEGGIGFDYRLAMAIPDKWIKLLKESPDEMWDMADIAHTLTNRRYNEKTIAYAESHDQALVGDKTISQWLFDAEIYHNMSNEHWPSPVIERGMALHKMIRLITFALGGDGYLNFMGNEFGHPEWIDFPRAGNGWSYDHARRRWDLADNPKLRYQYLQEWDRLMLAAEAKIGFCRPSVHQWVNVVNNNDKVIAFEKGNKSLFVFNFHPSKSYTDYRIGTYWSGKYKVVLDSDGHNVDGQGRVHWHITHQTMPFESNGRPYSLQLYLPARSCQIYQCIEADDVDKELYGDCDIEGHEEEDLECVSTDELRRLAISGAERAADEQRRNEETGSGVTSQDSGSGGEERDIPEERE